MMPVTSPSAVTVWTSACTDSRDDTSTVAVLTSNPALLRTLATASVFSWRRPANRTCLPALTRRAIAWPIDPGPMTTMTLLMMMPFRNLPQLAHQPLEHQVHTGLLLRTWHCQRCRAGETAPSDGTTQQPVLFAGFLPPPDSTTKTNQLTIQGADPSCVAEVLLE